MPKHEYKTTTFRQPGRAFAIIITFAVSLLLQACGGGSSSSSGAPTTTKTPVNAASGGTVTSGNGVL